MKELHVGAFLLTMVGGLNWGLVGLLDLNLVDALLGFYPMIERLVYILVGASAVYLVVTHKQVCKLCKGK